MPYLITITSDRGNATLRGTPLRLSAYDDMQAVEDAIIWQASGGFDTTTLVVAEPEPDLPGVMTSTDGKPVLIYNAGWTDEAFARFLVNTWGVSADAH